MGHKSMLINRTYFKFNYIDKFEANKWKKITRKH